MEVLIIDCESGKRWRGWFTILIVYLHQRLLHAIINFLSLRDEGFSSKESGFTGLASLSLFEIVFTTSIVLTTNVVMHTTQKADFIQNFYNVTV